MTLIVAASPSPPPVSYDRPGPRSMTLFVGAHGTNRDGGAAYGDISLGVQFRRSMTQGPAPPRYDWPRWDGKSQPFTGQVDPTEAWYWDGWRWTQLWVPTGTSLSQRRVIVAGPQVRVAQSMTAGGAALLIIGSFLPWATLFGFSKSGTSAGDGVITLICGAVVVGMVPALPRTWAIAVGFLAALAGAGTAAYDTVNISSTVVSVGYGLFVCDIGALVCLVGLVLALRSRPRA
jgi:hypothetical protein